MDAPTLSRRIGALDWIEIERELEETGHAVIPELLTSAECASMIELYPNDRRFRTRVDMDRLNFGRGTYAYFNEPLPRLVSTLRSGLYRRLAPIADRMNERLGRSARYPTTLSSYRQLCSEAGQVRPTPLLLRYEMGGYNRLHRDLYGTLHFPFQVAIGLCRPGVDFRGGQFLLVENRPRQQAIGDAIEIGLGTAIVFPVRERPVQGKQGFYRAQLRHGVSRITWGTRYTLGIIFHDSE